MMLENRGNYATVHSQENKHRDKGLEELSIYTVHTAVFLVQ